MMMTSAAWLFSQVSSGALLVLACTVSTMSLYLLLLAAASFRQPAKGAQGGTAGMRFAILIPAHDEEAVIGRLLASVNALDYQRERFEVFVVADHCSDQTATIARGLGATVHERVDPAPRGKSRSLNWLVGLLLARESGERPDAFVVVDADSTISRGFLRVMDAHLRAGSSLVQGTVEIDDTGAGRIAHLRGLAYALISELRPLGRTALGLSVGLRGSGLCMTSGCAARFPWDPESLTEDYELHARLLLAGMRVAYARQAVVRTQLPTSLKVARTQSTRWERGRLDAMRRHVPTLLRHGLLRRSWRCIDGAIELLVPPFSFLIVLTLALVGLSLLSGSVTLVILAAAALVAQGLYTLRGLTLVAARSPQIYRALLSVPAFLFWRLRVYLSVLLRRGPEHWVPTDRTPTE